MARIELPTIEVIEQRTIRRDHLHQRAQFRFKEIAFDLMDRPIDPLRAGRAAHLLIAQQLAQLLRGRHRNHPRCQTLRRSRLGFCFCRHHSRRKTVMEVNIPRSPRIDHKRFVVGDFGTSRKTNRRKRFAKNITSHPQWPPFACQREIHFPIRIVSVFPQKLRAGQRHLAPLLTRLGQSIGGRKRPRGTALKPNRFIIIDQRAVAIEASQHAALFAIPTVLRPKRQHIVEQAITVYRHQVITSFGGHQKATLPPIPSRTTLLLRRAPSVNNRPADTTHSCVSHQIPFPLTPPLYYEQPNLISRRPQCARHFFSDQNRAG